METVLLMIESKCKGKGAAQNTVPMPFFSKRSINRFWNKISITANNNLCWEWGRCTDSTGYGKHGVRDNGIRHTLKASRVAYFLYYGADPVGQLVLHKCDNRKCCNPLHLFLGDGKDNTQDMIKKGRINPPVGEKNGTAIFTEKDILQIRKERLAGESIMKIGKKFGVHNATISGICLRKTWKHI